MMTSKSALKTLSLLTFSLQGACSAPGADGADPASNTASTNARDAVVALASAALILDNPRPFLPEDTTVTMYHPRYKTCLLCAYTDMNSSVFGVGGPHVSAIPAARRQSIYLSFPYGHPTNPRSIVFLTTGQQDSDGNDDTLTGQRAGYAFRGREAQRVMQGDSLFGRITQSPLLAEPDTYLILVHDNAADWGVSDSWDIHRQFAKFVAEKVTSNTGSVVLAGYSRGGIMVAEMARYLRNGTAPLASSVPLYVGVFDGVAGGSHFGVDTGAGAQNPIHGSEGYKKELSDVDAQLDPASRQNSTFFFNSVSGASVAGTAVHAFGSRTYEVYPSYWMEHWERLAHGAYSNFAHSARLFDPFLSWLEAMQSRGASAQQAMHVGVGSIGAGTARELYVDALAGSTVHLGAEWSSGFDADIDIDVYTPEGALVARGVASSTSTEVLSFVAPVTGTYRAQVFAHRGAADTSIYHLVNGDPTRVGQILLPFERINSVSGWARTLDIKTAGEGSVNLRLRWENDVNSNLDLYVKDSSGNLIAQSATDLLEEHVSFPAAGRQHLSVEVRSRDAVETQFELDGSAPLAP